MAGLVSATMTSSDEVTSKILFDNGRMTKISAMLAKPNSIPDNTIHFSQKNRLLIDVRVQDYQIVLRCHRTAITDSALPTHISLSNASTALEEVAIDQKDILKTTSAGVEAQTFAPLSHTSLARRLQKSIKKRASDMTRNQIVDPRKTLLAEIEKIII